MVTINSQCRDCGSKNLRKFLDLGTQPLANSFLRENELKNPEPAYPLEVYVCLDCSLVQLIHVVDKNELFKNYIYFSSGMPKVSPYWKAYTEEIIMNFLKSKPALVVEIGSNDGVLLKFFKEHGYQVLGVDPAENIAKVAESRGIPTLATFFNKAVAEDIIKKYGRAKVILANNVFAHIDEHQDICSAIKILMDNEGVFVIEAPYLLDMFQNLAYDTIYHEHLSFLPVRPLIKLFAKFNLEIFNAKIVPAQGQSLRLFVGHKGVRPINENVFRMVKQELTYGLENIQSYFDLAKRVENSKNKLVAMLRELKARGKKIAAYGAPAKGNTLLNYCKIGKDILEYALEDLPSKVGSYTPGMHIPVVNRGYAETHKPDYYVMLAWNYQKAILEKESKFLEGGGHFIIPIGDAPQII